jgi:hypothetical protein
MKIKLVRIAFKDTYTIGKLYVDGVYFCDTIEDKDRGLDDSMTVREILNKKVKGETAIPTGHYNIEITYSPKYKRMMPLLIGVKGYSGIRIHSGNTSKDTEGCLLVGKNTKVGMVLESRNTYQRLFAMMQGQKNITIDIIRKG